MTGDVPGHWAMLERLYAQAPANQYWRPNVCIGAGTATITLEVRPDFLHSFGAVHGATYFKLLDDACYFAANSQVADVLLLTSDLTVHLLRPVSAGVMVGVGEVVSKTRTQIVASGRIHDANGHLLAHGVGTFVRSRVPLVQASGNCQGG